jgi:iron uptake system component EfeO
MMNPIAPRIAALVASTLLALGLAGACGGSGGGSGQPAGSIKVTMTEFKFDPSAIDARSGSVTFYLVNSGAVAHDLVVESQGGQRMSGSSLVQPGGTSVFSINLTAGSYRIVCDQPGHEANGMKGTLTVS